MFRLILFALMPVFVVAIVWPDAPSWLLQGMLVGMAALIALAWFRGTLILKCPYCGKRVKIGYSACHHCGRQLVESG